MALVIRQVQLTALARKRLEPVVMDMMAHLRAHFPKLEETPDWELGEEVQRTLWRGMEYELVSRRDLARFLNLAASLGWSFDSEMGWPEETLRDRSMSPSQRISLVVERCLGQIEEQARAAAVRREVGV